jgi:hypothetical protein
MSASRSSPKALAQLLDDAFSYGFIFYVNKLLYYYYNEQE